jgi:hypothetical protein
VTILKSKRWDRHVASLEKKNANRVLLVKTEREAPL